MMEKTLSVLTAPAFGIDNFLIPATPQKEQFGGFTNSKSKITCKSQQQK